MRQERFALRGFLDSVAVLLLVALAARLACVLASDRVVADVLRYQKVASHVLDVSWNPYEAARLYPYPPVWIGFEAAALWLSRLLGGGFALLVKLPVVAADLGIVWLLARARVAPTEAPSTGAGARAVRDARPTPRAPDAAPRAPAPAAAPLAAWAYALHPVALLVVGFHGQFDSLAILAVLLALVWHGEGRSDASALALAAGIATKSYPVLLLPVFLLDLPDWRRTVRYALLATVPVALLLLPFALANPSALARELFGYGGIADFGWIGLVRAAQFVSSGTLPRSEAAHWPVALAWGKLAFLASFVGLLVLYARRRGRGLAELASLAILLAFLGLYGAISAQYLLWVVPLGLLHADRHSVSFGVAATTALLGFYAFLAPGVLFAVPAGDASWPAAGRLWAAGLAPLLLATLLWLGATVRRLISSSATENR